MTDKPIRIQRKRNKGFRLQDQSPDGREVVSVCRPGFWGNPFSVGETLCTVGAVTLRHANLTEEEAEQGDVTQEVAIKLYRAWLLNSFAADNQRYRLVELRDKHLACFCKPEQSCHADVLLELANK